MTKQYLVGLSIGPVQDFIAAARRTRDLWFGSFVLSEISKAAASAFRESGAILIFPPAKTNLTPGSAANVGNKILIKVTTNDPKKILKIAETVARNRWKEFANQAKKNITVEETIWKEQVKDVLEFFGAWVYLEKDEDYGAPTEQGKGRKRLDQLLNARKNTREFNANPVLGDSIAKSSLDGLRESVLSSQTKSWQKRKLGLSAGEELDCIGVVKRLGGDTDQFTPLSRLAVDPWLRHIKSNEISLTAITNTLDKLLSTNLGLVSQVRGNNHIYNLLPYDGQLLYDFRLQTEIANLDQIEKAADEETRKNIEHAKKHLAHLQAIISSPPFNTLPKPSPYMAILAADGDRMGELLDSMDRIEDHQIISANLSEFAATVPETVRKFHGHCVYAGGDDVLALLPLDTAIPCAHQLSVEFKATLASIENIDEDSVPTLSVGLGVSHFLIPMGKQLDLARRAEQLAKSSNKPRGQSKNALAIMLQPRSGAVISFRERWDNEIPPDKLFSKWIKAHNSQLLPRGVGYALREASFALEWCKDSSVIEKETSRILELKRNSDGSLIEDSLIAFICTRAAKIGLAQIANELIITRRFAANFQLSSESISGETA
ncbi:MAG: type III-B CRISPR-associated protein Cas10/Cmr2 [Nitrosomonas sp.]|nr:MAG: type III-B CRISPR-associated protein Cas10/Cmr2 [Nitrosomonas sp.]